MYIDSDLNMTDLSAGQNNIIKEKMMKRTRTKHWN